MSEVAGADLRHSMISEDLGSRSGSIATRGGDGEPTG